VTQRISLGDTGGVLCNGESDDPKFNGNGESRRNDDGGGNRRHRISYDKVCGIGQCLVDNVVIMVL
jgi:hypothetical protein